MEGWSGVGRGWLEWSWRGVEVELEWDGGAGEVEVWVLSAAQLVWSGLDLELNPGTQSLLLSVPSAVGTISLPLGEPGYFARGFSPLKHFQVTLNWWFGFEPVEGKRENTSAANQSKALLRVSEKQLKLRATNTTKEADSWVPFGRSDAKNR